jgi:hypothetical protein
MTDGVAMESQPKNNRSLEEREFLFPENMPYYFLLGLILLLGLLFSFFSTTSIELTCIREPVNSVECSLVKNTPLLRMSPIKIYKPLSVDVIRLWGKGGSSYSAEIRAADISYKFSIFSSYNYGSVQNVSDEVNNFLLRSNEPSFLKTFPEKERNPRVDDAK